MCFHTRPEAARWLKLPGAPKVKKGDRDWQGNRDNTGSPDDAPEKCTAVMCNHCSKWRSVPNSIVVTKGLPDKWVCSMNTWDLEYADCNADEEVWVDEGEGAKGVPAEASKKASRFWTYEPVTPATDRLDNKWGPLAYGETTTKTLEDFLVLKCLSIPPKNRSNNNKREFYIRYLTWWRRFGHWRGTMEGWEDELRAIDEVEEEGGDRVTTSSSKTTTSGGELLTTSSSKTTTSGGELLTTSSPTTNMSGGDLCHDLLTTSSPTTNMSEGDLCHDLLTTSSSTTNTSGGEHLTTSSSTTITSSRELVKIKEKGSRTVSRKGPSEGATVKVDKLGEAITLRHNAFVTSVEYNVLKEDIINNQFERFEGVMKLMKYLNNEDINKEDYEDLKGALFASS
ncbi:hypothetical protein TrCOL_g11927 [Triparma columacea]|uniref:CW-type domain-containing protein n=1 Tax=Triparma columacea TaxID=722753 RepID=A0A9W7GMQ2_9STRA|nr:hypothetical protein TrCOL_g11927 [Triparma columacea]